MIDTIKLAFLVPKTVVLQTLESLGWRKRFDLAGNYVWTFKEKGKYPYFTLYKSPIGETFLCVTVSLPSFYRGSNARLLSATEIVEALRNLSEYVTQKIGIEFNAEEAKVWGVDFTRDYPVGSEAIPSLLKQVSEISIPRFDVGSYRNSTIYFHSKGTSKEAKKPRTICFYSKYEDAIKKGFCEEDILSTNGNLRCEVRYRDKRAVERLCEKLSLPDRKAKTLLTSAVFESVIGPIDEKLQLLFEQPSPEKRILKLLDKYGQKKFRTLLAHLTLKKFFGPNFYKIEFFGYSRSHYYNCQRDCANVGVWSLNEEQNQGLKLDNPP